MLAADDAVLEWLRAQERKELLRFVTIGSVDDGKSTLIGRLLHDAHGLYEDQLHAVKRASVRGSTRGAGSTSEIDFSLFTDGLVAEREQGITIDVAYRYFQTDRRKFIIADTPGHVQYTRNMATGASTADVAVILVDARLGVLAQTRRHAKIAALLGIPHVVACVNKMDLVGFDRAVFDAIAGELAAIGAKIGLQRLEAIPVSALGGDNVVVKSERLGWFDGPTLLEHLETVQVGSTAAGGAFRLPVQIVLRPGLGYRGFAGQIVSGSIRIGDEVVALPSGKRTKVVGVDVAGEDIGEARAPLSVAVRLADEIDVGRGDMLVRPDELPHVATEVEADLVWMNERPLDKDRSYVVKHTTRLVRARVEQVLYGTNPETLDAVPAETLGLNDIARVRLRCHAPLFFDAYETNRATGAFILVDSVTNDTIAAGMIVRPEPGTRASTTGSPGTHVSPTERRQRLGQRGGVVRIVAPTIERAREAAYEAERDLFDGGRVAVVVDDVREPDDAARACARGGLVAIVPAVGDETFAEIAGRRMELARVRAAVEEDEA